VRNAGEERGQVPGVADSERAVEDSTHDAADCYSRRRVAWQTGAETLNQ
jgi:hypothetical protein